jgi:hypothetical protein
MIQSAPDGRILDVGAGAGYWSALLAGLGADVVAIDDYSWWGKRGRGSNGTEEFDGTEDAGGKNSDGTDDATDGKDCDLSEHPQRVRLCDQQEVH